MTTSTVECAICAGPERDAELDRVEVWRDDQWRLSLSQHTVTRGFGYLEPIRHIPFLADLDGPEAATFGPAIARASAALREASGALLVYAYIFGGGIPHLHVHLVANAPAGVLNTNIISGEVEERKLPSGASELISRDHPDLPASDLAAIHERVREVMAR